MRAASLLGFPYHYSPGTDFRICRNKGQLAGTCCPVTNPQYSAVTASHDNRLTVPGNPPADADLLQYNRHSCLLAKTWSVR